MTVIRAVVLSAILITTTASHSMADAPSTAPAGPADVTLTAVRYSQNSICDVLEDVRDRWRGPMFIDWDYLEIDRDAPVSVARHNQIMVRDLISEIFASVASEKSKPVVEVIGNSIVVARAGRMAQLHHRLAMHDEYMQFLLRDSTGNFEGDARRFLNLPVPKSFSDHIEFADAITFLHVATGARLDVDWPSMESSGVKKTAVIQNVFGDVPLSTALTLMLTGLSTDQHRLDYKVVDDHIRIFATDLHPPDPGAKLLTTINFKSNTLADVVDNIGDASRSSIFVDWDYLNASGIKRDLPFSGEFTNTPVSRIAADIFAQAAGDRPKPVVETVDGVLIVTVPERLKTLKCLAARHPESAPGDAGVITDERLPKVIYSQSNLENVLNDLAHQNAIEIDVDWTALEKAGITRNSKVTLACRDARFATVLGLILFEAETDKAALNFSFTDGKIRITAVASDPPPK